MVTSNVNLTFSRHADAPTSIRDGHKPLFVVLLVLACGCAGPWARTNVVLPTTNATPTDVRASPIDEPSFGAETDESIDTDMVVRGQSIDDVAPGGGGHFGNAMPVTDASSQAVRQAQYTQTPAVGSSPRGYDPAYGSPGTFPIADNYVEQDDGQFLSSPGQGEYGGYPPVGSADGVVTPLPSDYADLVVNLRETQTGRFMFGVGVNSDLGLTSQAIIDERNFDWRRWPRSLDDIMNGTAWRGGGQSLRIEAVPGTEVQRYMVNFTQPYLFDTPISFNVSGYLYDRRYFDWDEQRLGGRIGLGYRITPDLSLAVALRGEQVDFHNPRVRGIPIIERALGESDIFSGKVSLTHDTRDLPFAATEGHYLELSYEQAFGTFDFPRGNVDYRRYFLLRQRADSSGRHTLSFNFRGGITGSQTPVYENFFAGGYSTLRGFRFRHASPKISDVIVGGQLSLLGTAEYIFPITADDMLKGALFCDYGTVEETYNNIDMEDFRVAVGAGLRISVPAMGPAPIAVDFAIPLAREDTDRIQNFSFFMGFGR